MEFSTEKNFAAFVKTKLKQIPNSWWVVINQRTILGTPDVIGCVNGTFIALELKKDARSKLTTVQSLNLKKIQESGGVAVRLDPTCFDVVYTMLLTLSCE